MSDKTPMLPEEIARREKIASLAGQITGMHMEAVISLAEDGLKWDDIAFAALLAVRSMITMVMKDEGQAKGAIEVLFKAAMKQSLMSMRFGSEEEMCAFMQEHGLTKPGDDVTNGVFMPPPTGPVH